MARKRRVFSEEFKAQAVQRVRERTAIGVTLAQLGRELAPAPSHAAGSAGTATAETGRRDPGES
jgi:transposase-like protein